MKYSYESSKSVKLSQSIECRSVQNMYVTMKYGREYIMNKR